MATHSGWLSLKASRLSVPPGIRGAGCEFLDANIAEFHGGPFSLEAEVAATVLESAHFPGAPTVAPEGDPVADGDHAPVVPFAHRLLQVGHGVAPLGAAHQLADGRLRQVDLVRLAPPAAPDEESAFVLVAHRPPLEADVEVAELAPRRQVRAVPPRKLDHPVFHLPVLRH